MRLELAQATMQVPPGWSISIRPWFVAGVSPNARNICFIHFSGKQEWLRDGLPHRDDGPALVEPDGGKLWYHNGVLIRNPRL